MLNLRGDSCNIADCGLTPQIDALKGASAKTVWKKLVARTAHRKKQEMAPAFSFGVMAGLPSTTFAG